MKNKTYSNLEQKFYTTPVEEAAFLSGAFQTVAMAGISVGAGWIPGVLFLLVTDRYFSKPYRDDKDMRSSNLKGWVTGFAASLAIIYGVNAFNADDAVGAKNKTGQSEMIAPVSNFEIKPS